MKIAAALCATLVLAACGDGMGPRRTMVGTYALQTLDGAALPAAVILPGKGCVLEHSILDLLPGANFSWLGMCAESGGVVEAFLWAGRFSQIGADSIRITTGSSLLNGNLSLPVASARRRGDTLVLRTEIPGQGSALAQTWRFVLETEP